MNPPARDEAPRTPGPLIETIADVATDDHEFRNEIEISPPIP